MKIPNVLANQAALLARSSKCCTEAKESGATPRRERTRSEQGNVLVELAVALPLIMLLFTGIFAFAAVYNNQIILTQAVGAGGQFLQQLRNTTTDPCKDTLTAIENSAPSLTPANISLTLTLNGTKVSGSTCSGDQSYLVESAPVTVSATYPCKLQIYSMTFASGCQLSAQITEYEY